MIFIFISDLRDKRKPKQISDETKVEIINLSNGGMSTKDIARKYDICESRVNAIRRKRINLQKKGFTFIKTIPQAAKNTCRLTDTQISTILKLSKVNMNNCRIAHIVGISESSVRKYKKCYFEPLKDSINKVNNRNSYCSGESDHEDTEIANFFSSKQSAALVKENSNPNLDDNPKTIVPQFEDISNVSNENSDENLVETEDLLEFIDEPTTVMEDVVNSTPSVVGLPDNNSAEISLNSQPTEVMQKMSEMGMFYIL